MPESLASASTGHMVSPGGKIGWESRVQGSVSEEEGTVDIGEATKNQRSKAECQAFLVKTKLIFQS